MEFAKTIETKRLTLSPISLLDFLFFWRLTGNLEVRRYLGGPVPWKRRITQFRNYIKGHKRVGVWAVRMKGSRKTIGLLILSPHKDGVEYEVSYEFNPNFWSKGLASEATSSVINHGINDLKLKQIIAETQSANTASCRMLRKLGFIEVRKLERFGAEQVILIKSK